MRLRKRDLSTVYLKKRLSDFDDEGNSQTGYELDPVELQMNVQSAGGQVMAAVYGESLPYIKSCKYQGDLIKPGQNEKDGICLYVSEDEDPDYQILAIEPYSTHLNITLKKLGDS